MLAFWGTLTHGLNWSSWFPALPEWCAIGVQYFDLQEVQFNRKVELEGAQNIC